MGGMLDVAKQVLMGPEQRIYGEYLDRVVNGTDGMTIMFVENGTFDLIGNINNASIDIGDILGLPVNNSPITQASALMHETWEQYQMQVASPILNPIERGNEAHLRATRVESRIVGYQMDPYRVHHPIGNEGFMHVRSTDGKHNAIVHTFKINIINVRQF